MDKGSSEFVLGWSVFFVCQSSGSYLCQPGYLLVNRVFQVLLLLLPVDVGKERANTPGKRTQWELFGRRVQAICYALSLDIYMTAKS